ncbi:MAG TPA: hypothetical protein VGD81_04740 [Opitutaceae bacterium]
MISRHWLVLAMVASAVATTGCDAFAEPNAAAAGRTAPQVICQIYFDLSPSVTSVQRQIWEGMAQNDLLPSLADGWQIEIYGLHDHTEDSAPVFRDALPVLPKGAGMAEDLEYRQKRQEFRVRFVAAVHRLLGEAHAPAKSTSILSAFNRIHRGDGRNVILVLFTGALESRDAAVNLEKTRFEAGTVAASVQRVVSAHQWTRESLAGTRVFFVLSDIPIGSVQSGPNSRDTLRSFWARLVTTLGGVLENFDSYFAHLPPHRTTVAVAEN